MTIRVAIAGPRGKMGKEAVHTVMKADNMELVAVLDHKEIAENLTAYTDFPEQYDVPVFTDLEALITTATPEVFVDLTTPKAVYTHTKTLLQHNVRPVIGTTGFTDEQLQEVTDLAKANGTGAIIAPNFAIGAILMMKFAQNAAKYFSDVEFFCRNRKKRNWKSLKRRSKTGHFRLSENPLTQMKMSYRRSAR